MKRTMKTLELNHTYLVQFGSSPDMIYSFTTINVSEEAYQFRRNTDTPSTEWMLKKRFAERYTIIEDITNLMVEIPNTIPITDTQLKLDFPEFNFRYAPDYKSPFSTTEWEACPRCGGTGQIPSDGMTSVMYQTCPLCNGAKIIVKKITNYQ